MTINLNHNAKFYAIALKMHQKAQAKMIEVGSDSHAERLNKVIDAMIVAGESMNDDLRALKRKIGR